jgi:hypothetical protein
MNTQSLKSSVRQLLLRRYALALNLPPHMRKILSAEGALGRAEANLLFELAAGVQEGCIVEVGSFRGKSTVALALGSQRGSDAPVFAIDPHEPFTGVVGGEFGTNDRIAFYRNMLRTNCAETVRLINLPSQMVAGAWSKPISLLWLDGDHSYDAVSRDFAGFNPFILPGGYVAFHDSLDPKLGPAQVIQEVLTSSGYRKVAQQDLTTVLQKSEETGAV